MNQKQYERWRKIRIKGHGRFVIVDGVLKMGVPLRS
jgi:hypothetical protein